MRGMPEELQILLLPVHRTGTRTPGQDPQNQPAPKALHVSPYDLYVIRTFNNIALV